MWRQYEMADGLELSDHRPVCAALDLRVDVGVRGFRFPSPQQQQQLQGQQQQQLPALPPPAAVVEGGDGGGRGRFGPLPHPRRPAAARECVTWNGGGGGVCLYVYTHTYYTHLVYTHRHTQ